MLFFERGLAHVDYGQKDSMFDGDKYGMNESIYEEADFSTYLPGFPERTYLDLLCLSSETMAIAQSFSERLESLPFSYVSMVRKC